jgi:NAD(P)-dependent dehydrogenase (short-subunit alcohol dehydrogenase family)
MAPQFGQTQVLPLGSKSPTLQNAAAKFAVEGMSLSLQQELAPLGIRVTLIEPGAFRTDFLEDNSIRYTATQIPDYDGTSGAALRYLAGNAGKQIGDPDRAEAVILQAIDASNPPLHLFLGPDAFKRAHDRIEQVTKELQKWQDLPLTTSYPEAACA